MGSSTVTPHDHYCLAKEYERRNRQQDAADLYLKASKNGHLSAMVAYATHLIPTDESSAFVWFRAAAERGDPRAWYELGQLLARGRHFEVNAVDAARCWKRAAQLGDNVGKSALGLCYIRGFGVKQDPGKGVEIVKQVADIHNDVTAMKNLAWIYRHGKGVPKDSRAAEYWEDRAKSQEVVLNRVTSRELALFGRGRSRTSKIRRDWDKLSSGAGRENSSSERATRLSSNSHHSKDQDAPKTGDMEVNLVDSSDNRRRQSSNHSATAPDLGHRGQTFSPNPVRGSDLPESLEGDTQLAQSNEPGVQESVRDVHQSETRNRYSGDDILRKHPDPALASEVADLSFISKERDPESPKNDQDESRLPDYSYQNGGRESSVSTGEAGRFSERIVGREALELAGNALRLPTRSQEVAENESEFVVNRGALEGKEANDAGRKNSQTVGPSNYMSNQNSDDNVSAIHSDYRQNFIQQGSPSAGPSTNAVPSVSARKKLFEPEQERDALRTQEPNLGSQAYIQEGVEPSAARAEPYNQAMSGHTNADDQDNVEEGITNFETNDYEDSERDHHHATSAADAIDGNRNSYVRSQAPTDKDDGASTEATQKTDAMIQNLSLNEGSSIEGGEDAVVLERLRIVLSDYPTNPTSAGCQPALNTMVKTIQETPLTNGDAYNIMERNSGFFKVVVSMISQYEDEQIQEYGLHCLLHILRAMPVSSKENALLTTYADSFRIIQRTEHMIASKGIVGVREERSGAIQAVVLAMRNHSTIRRIQLAGCAALGEIALTSASCRSAALEQGSVNILAACLRHRSTNSAAVIHEMAGRAISNFCNGKENVFMKEAFSNAGTVAELLKVLQLWGHNDEAVSDLMTKATICCCCGLRHLTDGYTPASVQAVQLFAYHNLIRIMVLKKDDVAVCTVVVGALTSITRNAGSAAEKPLMDANPLPEVLATMQIHSHNALFIRKALDLMEALASFEDMRQAIVIAGGTQFANGIVQQGGNDPSLLERACGVIDKLCKDSTPNQEIFASENGMKSLTTLLNSHSRQPGVVESCLFAMSSAASNNAASQREAMLASAPEELVKILSMYSSKNAKVVAACSGSMSALITPRNINVAQKFANSNAPELVVRAMKRHPDSALVQENGSSAIAAFCEADPKIMSSLLKSNITNILVVALQRFLHKQSAVVQIVRAMRSITNQVIPEDSYRFKSKLLTDRSNESSLPEIFHTALTFHKKSLPDTSNVIISICATINTLCMRSVAFKNEVGKDGIVEELKELVERTAEFKDLGVLQPVLATICTLVLESEENKNRFHAVGGVNAILDVLQKWKHDTYILEHCCAALRYSCNDHFGNCDEVKNHNGVRIILGVMEMHPDVVNLTLWCCLTLADLCKGDEELQNSATVVQSIRKVVAAMREFPTNSRFLSSACDFLRAASDYSEDNKERIVRLGGRTAIVQALEDHPMDSTLTESAAYALLQLEEIPDPRTSVDSSPQPGFVQRFSRELRRSSSSSNRSSKSRRSGRKSLPLSSRRKTSQVEDDRGRERMSRAEYHHEHPEGRGIKSSLKGLQRLLPRRKSRTERSEEPHFHEDSEQRRMHDEYDDYDEDDDDYREQDRIGNR